MTKREIIRDGRAKSSRSKPAPSRLWLRASATRSPGPSTSSTKRNRGSSSSGMGKSGLVGRKIAATLASCGTPAMFIHPAEAGHGDLGMILEERRHPGRLLQRRDARDRRPPRFHQAHRGQAHLPHRGRRNSQIARYSDIVLDARVEREAEPSGLVPTASSTAALALGDALAVAVMKKKGFSEKDFAFVHPKGALGKKLLRIEHADAQGPGHPRRRGRRRRWAR